MDFETVLRTFHLGGPKVSTVLATAETYPGTPLMGAVRLQGGDYDLAVDTIAVGLVTRVEAEDGDALLEFHRAWVAAGFTLAAGEHQDIPFTITPPWETPLTHAYGHRLAGMSLALRTEVEAEDEVDREDASLLTVHPLPAQELVLNALTDAGFHFRHADVERGAIYGVRLELPFYQEIEFTPPARWARTLDELELTFVADAEGVEVILEYERHGGLFRAPQDSYARFRLGHGCSPSEAAAALHRALP
ncbi:sporulation protein [Actinoplanes sp. RD1]|uniref:sporulation protein n=1 Tax=Actinoplanes sp. RD1 TaxID=3064538 RepID=UPI002741AD99|nr:sporulation protein [Actinoplanes sp. RD1]